MRLFNKTGWLGDREWSVRSRVDDVLATKQQAHSFLTHLVPALAAHFFQPAHLRRALVLSLPI